MKCRWCDEPLRFVRGKGWVHLDGKTHRARVDADGIERDDHAVLAVPDDTPMARRPPVRRRGRRT